MTKQLNQILMANQVMETNRCLLRKITLEDIDDMYEYCRIEEVSKYTKFNAHQSKNETKQVIEEIFIPKYLTEWGIVLKETNKLIGTIDYISLDEHCATIGYALSRDFWGRGIVPEVSQKLLELSFEKLKLKVVYASHHISNISSGKVMKKIGMTLLGKDYYFDFKNKPLVEVVKYGMTYEDYIRLNSD